MITSLFVVVSLLADDDDDDDVGTTPTAAAPATADDELGDEADELDDVLLGLSYMSFDDDVCVCVCLFSHSL